MISEGIAVAGGAALGALSRWGLSTYFNPLFPTVPLGTLLANLVGGYLIGIAVAVFTSHTGLPAELRLFVITGFLGGLTTFSTFSAEVVSLIGGGQFGWALAAVGAHLLGSLLLTILGMASAGVILRGIGA
ncbi:MAG: fluoride ion transporter CrcB [Proteobacteria bacterium]|nr:fluoride ion transporter CrcB [Pseudomonadota bacterium]